MTLEAKAVPEMTWEFRFTRYIYHENVSMPVDIKFIAKRQREDDRLNDIKEQFPNVFRWKK